ncbi:MAG: hypothetical protein K9H61_03405 [Bacteroidia bacterium]|nr:hypothetical protein [Bacteroidia bacterium]MCF8425687.1 hypothetical protein [Bacteroidia bacterium]MCF8446019.1 hypothetical protein [Bacteroidia bacterium]
MKTYTPVKPEKISSTSFEELNSLYKVYVGFEKNRIGNISFLEIIDGYLKPNESLAFRGYKELANTEISCFEIEIIQSAKINTYLKIPVQQSLKKTVLVKVCKEEKNVGYQCVDLDGTILSQPTLIHTKVMGVLKEPISNN